MSDTSRVVELKEALQARLNFINEGMDKGIKISSGENGSKNLEISSDDYKALRKAHAESQQITQTLLMEMGVKSSHALLDQMNASMYGAGSAAMGAGAAGSTAVGGMDKLQGKTLGELLTDSPEFKSMMTTKSRKMDAPFTIEGVADLPGMGRKDVWYGSAGLPNYPRRMGGIQFDPMVPRAHRTTRVRDLFPVSATTASAIDFFKVTGYGQNQGAQSVPDYDTSGQGSFGLKPHTDLQFTSQQVNVRTIAHWEAAHRNVLDDVPQLQGTINNELTYGLQLEEDRQILLGSGEDEELLGILNTTGIQTYTQGGSATGEQMADTLRKAATRVMLAYFAPTGYVLHPYDWEQVELQKGNGDGQYMLVTNVSIGASAQVWRQPVVETPAMPQGTFLTGAFGLGAQLYDRQQSNVRIAEQHADFFLRNAVVVLAEERLALATKRPESFVKGTFVSDTNP